MDLSFMQDARWRELDLPTQQKVLGVVFDDNIGSDERYGGLPDDMKEKVRLEFMQDAYSMSEHYARPEGRGFGGAVAGAGRGIARGVVKGAGMVAGAGEWFAPEGSGAEDFFGKVKEGAEKRERQFPGLFAESQRSIEAQQEKGVTPRAWLEPGFESVGMMAPGIGAGIAIGGSGLVSGLVTGTQFWGGTAQEEYNRISEERPELPEGDRVTYANMRGFAEGGLEALQAAIPFRLTKLLPKGSGKVLKGISGQSVKPAFQLAKDMVLKVQIPEVAMEVAQETLGQITETGYGLREDLSVSEISRVIGPTIVASFGLGLGGTVGGVSQRNRLANALKNPETPLAERESAVVQVYNETKKHDPDLADMWLEQSAPLLKDNKPIIVQNDSFYEKQAPEDVLGDLEVALYDGRMTVDEINQNRASLEQVVNPEQLDEVIKSFTPVSQAASEARQQVEDQGGDLLDQVAASAEAIQDNFGAKREVDSRISEKQAREFEKTSLMYRSMANVAQPEIPQASENVLATKRKEKQDWIKTPTPKGEFANSLAERRAKREWLKTPVPQGQPSPSGVAADRDDVKGFPSTRPEWFKLKNLKAYDKKHGTNYAEKVNSLTVARTLKNVKAGNKLSPAQQNVWNYLQEVAEDIKDSDRDLAVASDIQKMEKSGFEPAYKDIAAVEFNEGDQIIVGEGIVPIGKYVVKGENDQGKVILDGESRVTVDSFDMLNVEGVKKTESVPKKLTKALGKPTQVETLEQMGVTDETKQIGHIVKDSVGQKLDIAENFAQEGKTEKAEKLQKEALADADKLIKADGKITEMLVEEELSQRQIVYKGTERRKNLKERKRFEEMSDKEKREAYFAHEVTGLKNRRAYEEAETQEEKFKASIDVDSLKYVNDYVGGYEAGDVLLQTVGNALQEVSKEAYHVSGDEFVVRGDSISEVREQLDKATDILSKTKIYYEAKDGKRYTYTGPGISFGISESKKEADTKLKEHKTEREKTGERAARGERPPGLAEETSKGRETDRGATKKPEIVEDMVVEVGKRKSDGTPIEMTAKDALDYIDNQLEQCYTLKTCLGG